MGLSLFQGVLGNLSEISPEKLQEEFGDFLMEGETIQTGFKLIRDGLIITDRRLIEFDRQGATGQKVRIASIYLASIFQVSVETAGFGTDDSEITLTYVTTPNLRAHRLEVEEKSFEFPRTYDIQALYRNLQEVAYRNYERLNA